tara:strand:- start:215 stop:661 length:447 start_codon:yes stop_codon:yes gene_type:complete
MMIRYFGLTKIPLILVCRPRVVSIDQGSIVIRVPLNRMTRNHLGSMYFGALSVGADVAAGFLALDRMESAGRKLSLIFKDFSADFHKRPEGDVDFRCEDGQDIDSLIDRAITSNERSSAPVSVIATVPSVSDEPVASFSLTLSLKAVE